MADKTLNVKIRQRFDTEANWSSKNPVLLSGEMAFTSNGDNAGKFKVGNGTSKWSELKYSYNTSNADDIVGLGYFNTHPENNGTIIPFIYNDLAFLSKKGGSYSVYSTTSTDYTVATLNQGTISYTGFDNVFDASPSYAMLSTVGDYVAVIDLTLNKTYTYSNSFYIDFGASGWRAKSIAVYVMNSATESKYTLKNSTTTNEKGNWYCIVSHSSKNSSDTTVQGFNKLRIVLNKFNSTTSTSGKRISQIGLINYSSSGVNETFISRGGCSGIYGSLIPQTTNNADLGSSSKRWKNIYANTFDGTATKANTLTGLTSTVAELNYVDGVKSNIQTQLDGKSSNGHKHKVSDISDLTANATELNYMDGVTSNVQTQLNSKSPTSHSHDLSSMINTLSVGTSNPTDTDYYVCQYAGGGTSTTSYHRRSMSSLWNWIKNKLATVAISGSYNDLKNKPTIPTVGNGTVTIKQAGTSKGTFTMNQSGNTTIELTDSNTWRGIQDNLTSTSTTDSLSAAKGKWLNDNKAAMTQLTNQDLNNVTTPGFYNAGGGNHVTNRPSSVDHFGLIVVHRAAGAYYVQIIFNDSKSFRRFCVNGTWGDWVEEKITDTTYSVATTSTDGLMSKSDKSKLNGIDANANKTIVDTTMSATSTNPVQNKVIKASIDAVSAKVDNIIKDAPAAYDTLKEVGEYIATHKNEYNALLEITSNKVNKGGDTMTGTLTAPILKASSYFNTPTMVGEGDNTKYYHRVDFGYSGKNTVDFYEYGGVYNFYKNTAGTKDKAELIGSIQSDGFHGNIIGNATTATNVKWSGVTDKPNAQNNLTSTSTTDYLAASQGKVLKDLVDARLPITGGTMSGSISSSLATNTYLSGNQGRAIINSTSNAGSYTMLAKMNSSNGFFTQGTYNSNYLLQYTHKDTVANNTNAVTKSVTLLDESGNSSFPGTVSGTFKGNLTGTATKATQDGSGNTITSKYVAVDTTQTISGAKTFSNVTTISNTTASTSKSTGALKVSGGVGIAGRMSANEVMVGDGCTLKFDSANKCVNFVFS